jgi:hypothetical protein
MQDTIRFNSFNYSHKHNYTPKYTFPEGLAVFLLILLVSKILLDFFTHIPYHFFNNLISLFAFNNLSFNKYIIPELISSRNAYIDIVKLFGIIIPLFICCCWDYRLILLCFTTHQSLALIRTKNQLSYLVILSTILTRWQSFITIVFSSLRTRISYYAYFNHLLITSNFVSPTITLFSFSKSINKV